MRIAIAGAHGQIGRRLGSLLAGRGDEVVGLHRKPEQAAGLRAAGVGPYLLDLEGTTVDELGDAIDGCDGVVFAAGAGPGSGLARKDAVDRAAAVLLADAAERAGVRRYVLVSSTGVDRVRGGATPDGVDDVFIAYLRAKLAAEDDVRGRDLDWTVLRPGRLTDEPGRGSVTLSLAVQYGDVPRDDVAATVVALLDEPRTAGLVLELVSGEVPVRTAVVDVVG